MERRRLSYLIPEIYESTVDPSHWDYVLEVLAKMTKSKAACLFYNDLEFEVASTVAQFGFKMDMLKDFETNYTKTIPETGNNRNSDQSIDDTHSTDFHFCQQYYPGSENFDRAHEDFFHNWLNPYGYYYMGGVQFRDSHNQSASIIILRDKEAGPWEANEIRIIDDVLAHVKRALNIHSEFTRLRVQYDALHKGLDRLVIGLVLFDRYAHPVYMNPTAKSIIENHPALSINKVGFFLNQEEQNTKLQQTILEVARIDSDDTWKQTIALGITHPDIESTLPILITPMHAHQLTSDLVGYEGANVAVFLSDPNQEQPISPGNLMSVYGLSKSEAQVAIGIANGHSIEEIANTSSRSQHTIRSQLKAIFNKMGVSRQSELIKLLLTGPFSHRRKTTERDRDKIQ